MHHLQLALPLVELVQANLCIYQAPRPIGLLFELRHGYQIVHHIKGVTLNSGAVWRS